MRRILRGPELVVDAWRQPGEPGEGPQLLTLAELRAAMAVPDGSGVRLAAGEDVMQLAPFVPRLALVVLQFERIGEGRGYTQAVLLRRRLGYRGELRAAGALGRDQLFLLARCGFDAFDLDAGEDLQAAQAQLARFSVAYQSAPGLLVQPRLRG